MKMHRINMFASTVALGTAVSQSAVASVVGEGNVTLATSGSVTMGGARLVVEVSYDQGGSWKQLVDQAGNRPVVDSSEEEYRFTMDGGLLRVSPLDLSGTTSIEKVLLVGDVDQQVAPS